MKHKVIACTVALALYGFAWNATATVSDYLPVGGVLADLDGVPLDGPHNMTFALYDGVSAVTAIWTESYDSLEIQDGLFTVYLGTVTQLAFDDLILAPELWLGVTVGTDSEMERIALGTVPFAMEAYQCRAVGNLEEGDIQPMLSGINECVSGTFLVGWDATLSQPICEVPGATIVTTDWTNAGIVWTSPYSDSGTFTSSLEYRKIDNMVFLRGTGNSGSTHVQVGQTVATLPVGFRPISYPSYLNLIRCCPGPAGIVNTYISTSGEIVISEMVVDPGDRQFIYFDGISFSTI